MGGGHCVLNADCPAGNTCINGYCHLGCAADSGCGAHDRCVTGVCQPDDRPRLGCRANSDCTAGEMCVSGVCRTSCGANADCCACTTAIICGPGGYCITPGEAAPQCHLSADCGSTLSCVDALCM